MPRVVIVEKIWNDQCPFLVKPCQRFQESGGYVGSLHTITILNAFEYSLTLLWPLAIFQAIDFSRLGVAVGQAQLLIPRQTLIPGQSYGVTLMVLSCSYSLMTRNAPRRCIHVDHIPLPIPIWSVSVARWYSPHQAELIFGWFRFLCLEAIKTNDLKSRFPSQFVNHLWYLASRAVRLR